MRRRAALATLALLLAGCAPAEPISPDGVTALVPVVVAEHPHDAQAFTQGLEVLGDGTLVESTGLYGESTVRVVEVATGEVLASRDLPAEQFGEGLTVVDGTVHQLTWKAGVAHSWELPGLEPAGTTSYAGQGWGLCHDEDAGVLWRSDGSDALRAHDPATMAPLATELHVTLRGEPVHELNELECAGGSIWANVWRTDQVVEVDPGNGHVVSVLDARALREAVEASGTELDANQVLNGIAHDPTTGHWYLTGKQWPTLFEVRFEAAGGGNR